MAILDPAAACLRRPDPIAASGTAPHPPILEADQPVRPVLTLQISETAVPSVASAIAFLNRMPVDARDLVLAACSKAGGDVASPLPMSFDAAHPPAGWRSIGDVPPVSVLAPIFASPAWAKRFERGTELQAYSATCYGLKSLSIALAACRT